MEYDNKIKSDRSNFILMPIIMPIIIAYTHAAISQQVFPKD